MDKYAELKKCGTHGANYGLGPEDILARFQEWDNPRQSEYTKKAVADSEVR
jgi:hypothetical protein